MTLTKHLSPWIVLIAILTAAAFIIPAIVKTSLAILTLALAYLTYESFRDRDAVPGLVFAPLGVICGFLAMVSV